MGIQVGSKWKCTDEGLEQFDMVGKIIEVNDHPDWNGDGEIEIKHEDNSIAVIKVRRFYLRYEKVNGET
jgi:hypothetical protein